MIKHGKPKAQIAEIYRKGVALSGNIYDICTKFVLFLLSFENDLTEAEEICLKGISSAPERTDLYVLLCKVAHRRKNYDQALKKLLNFLETDKSKSEMFILTAFIYKNLGEEEAFTKHLRKAENLLVSDIQYNRAMISAVKDDEEATLKQLKRIIRNKEAVKFRLVSNPVFESMQHSPNFQDFLDNFVNEKPKIQNEAN